MNSFYFIKYLYIRSISSILFIPLIYHYNFHIIFLQPLCSGVDDLGADKVQVIVKLAEEIHVFSEVKEAHVHKVCQILSQDWIILVIIELIKVLNLGE